MARKSIFGDFLNIAFKSTEKAVNTSLKEKKRNEAKSVYAAAQQQTTLQYEVDNRKRILNDCFQLIDSSLNINVLLGRKDIAIGHLNWFIEKRHYGVTLTPPPEQGKDQLYLNFNKSLHRAIEELISKQIARVETLKSKQAKQNVVDKAIGILQTNMQHFDKNTANYYDLEVRIEALREKLNSLLETT